MAHYRFDAVLGRSCRILRSADYSRPRRILPAVALFLVVNSGSALALSLQDYDVNGDGILSAQELHVKHLHDTVPIYDQIDTIHVDGSFEPDELAAFYASAEAKAARTPNPLARKLADGGIALKTLVADREKEKCAERRGLYIRHDRFDLDAYSKNFEATSTRGAAFNIGKDGSSTTATIDGVVSYVTAAPCIDSPTADSGDPHISGYVLAPWVLGSGTLHSDSGDADTSKLQAGFDTQFEVTGLLADKEYLKVSPYYQTDFRGRAQVYGAEYSWEPYQPSLRLGGGDPLSPYFDYYSTAKLIADYRHVGNAGGSGLTPHTNYGWLGTSVGVNGLILPEAFDRKLFFNTHYDWYWDAFSSRTASLVDASAGWNISNATSVSVNYKSGLDKDTFATIRQIDISLNLR